jgi:GNAT superfamily N-acetyltransferase
VQGANLEDVLPSYNPIDGKVFIGKPTNNWMAVYMEGIEGQHNISSKVDLINRIANDHVLAQISDHSGLVAVGLCVCEGEWSGIFCMHTLNSHRRQGYASQILSALTDWARVKGAKQMYLQVEQENSAAQKFYQASGFKIQYGYQYRVRENITCE